MSTIIESFEVASELAIAMAKFINIPGTNRLEQQLRRIVDRHFGTVRDKSLNETIEWVNTFYNSKEKVFENRTKEIVSRATKFALQRFTINYANFLFPYAKAECAAYKDATIGELSKQLAADVKAIIAKTRKEHGRDFCETCERHSKSIMTALAPVAIRGPRRSISDIVEAYGSLAGRLFSMDKRAKALIRRSQAKLESACVFDTLPKKFQKAVNKSYLLLLTKMEPGLEVKKFSSKLRLCILIDFIGLALTGKSLRLAVVWGGLAVAICVHGMVYPNEVLGLINWIGKQIQAI
jgi:hypothetical protein